MTASPRDRPYVLLSCAVSVDGCLDGTSGERLVLSSEADLDRVDEVRAGCDAILVGAGTIRRDDPRLVIRDPARRTERAARGQPPDPAKVTVTATGGLDPGARFFTLGGAPKLVYCASPAAGATASRLGGSAAVIDAGDPPRLSFVLADLAKRRMRRILVEGGAQVLRHFLAGGLADELQLVIAPFFVGDPAAPRFAAPADYPHGPANPMRLAGARTIGDHVLLRYLLGPR
jgi:5-amino-6-(5-phosphoribosylamino)uracil reductase